MADHFSTLHAVAEDVNEDGVSPTSPTSRRSHTSPLKDFAPSLFSQRSGYHKMPDDNPFDDQEMLPLDLADQPSRAIPSSSASPPQLHPMGYTSPELGMGGLGISGLPSRNTSSSANANANRRSIIRKPLSTKSPPDTPQSRHGLLGSNDTTAASTPMIGGSFSKGRDSYVSSHSRNQGSWDVTEDIGDRAAKPTNLSPDSDGSNKYIATPATTNTSSAQQTPGQLHPRGEFSDDEDDFDDEVFYKGFGEPPSYCVSRGDIHEKRTSWLSITIFVLSIYSTVMSGIWLVTAIIQPRWGQGISSQVGLNPSTATTVSSLVSKTIEMSFVTVFVACLGQVLTRRSFVRKTAGMTLGEMTMRNWVIQPGSLITHAESIPSAGLTVLGALALTATVAATFYTTASDAMISPKLKFGDWENKQMSGRIRTSYANANWVQVTCPSVIKDEDKSAAESCMNIQFSGQSYRNLQNYMQTWTAINNNGSKDFTQLANRPPGSNLLYDNTTLAGSWIETASSDVEANFEKHQRIVNNVSLAMPHPGVYSAATDKMNGILQPKDLAGVGEYSVRAAVVSPAVNVMCVDLSKKELEPLVYTEWDDAKVEPTDVGNQKTGHDGWQEEVPVYSYSKKKAEWLNRTDVDDIFRWGPKYERLPPVFQLYPADYNFIVNSTVFYSDSIYILGKNLGTKNYTICELKSWLSPNCSTEFDISGKTGGKMSTHCEDPEDKDSYLSSNPDGKGWNQASLDWKWIADSWRLSMDLNGGVSNVNASNARFLSQLALTEPRLPEDLPSMAEALAVYASSTLTISAKDSSFRHYWDHDEPLLKSPGAVENFNASIRTQQYTSGHVSSWQGIFYVVLILVFIINLFCLVYFVLRSGLVTDYTEPQNLFALAINSPPSAQLRGACGAGPVKRDLVVPWRVAYAPSAHHYFFEEANSKPWKGKYSTEAASTSSEYGPTKGSSYKRLSSVKGWL